MKAKHGEWGMVFTSLTAGGLEIDYDWIQEMDRVLEEKMMNKLIRIRQDRRRARGEENDEEDIDYVRWLVQSGEEKMPMEYDLLRPFVT